MRYLWATLAAAAIIALGSLFVWRTRAAVEQTARDQLAAGGKPAPADAPRNPDGVGLEMSGPQVLRVSLADILIDFWYVFVVLVILICFGAAAFSGQRPASTLPGSSKSEH